MCGKIHLCWPRRSGRGPRKEQNNAQLLTPCFSGFGSALFAQLNHLGEATPLGWELEGSP